LFGKLISDDENKVSKKVVVPVAGKLLSFIIFMQVVCKHRAGMNVFEKHHIYDMVMSHMNESCHA